MILVEFLINGKRTQLELNYEQLTEKLLGQWFGDQKKL